VLPDATLPVPASLASLPAWFAPLFTAPSLRTFTMLACGFIARAGRRTVCGMLAGTGLSRAWPHDRAHWFFSRARWNADDLGLAAARLVVALLVPAGQPVTAAIDDTLFRRRGKKVWAASWFHDGSAPGPAKTGYGHNWVVAGIVALITTDATASPAQVIHRYAARWSIEVAIEDSKQIFGAGQARNRTARAVERTVPFQLACQAIATAWYATAGHDPADAADHRARAPRYTTKAQPSTAGMLAKLRRVLTATRFRASHHDQPTPEEIRAIRLAWEDITA
jgi:DDE superfamily endonuclease